jgi:phosphoenolpyruvate carboxykinase (GTP)
VVGKYNVPVMEIKTALGARADPAKLPGIYFVNWFRKGEDGAFVWPGFGDNARVLKWIAGRLDGEAEALDTPVGRVPAPGALDVEGLSLSEADLATLLEVDADVWTEEAGLIPEFYAQFGDRLPRALWDQHAALTERLAAVRIADQAAAMAAE